MTSVPFPGSVEIKPLKGIHDDRKYLPTFAARSKDRYNDECIVVAYKPSKEDLDALNRGDLLYINVTGRELPSMNVFTMDEDGYSNDPGLDDEFEGEKDNEH